MKQVEPFRHNRNRMGAFPIAIRVGLILEVALVAYIGRAVLHLHQLLIAPTP